MVPVNADCKDGGAFLVLGGLKSNIYSTDLDIEERAGGTRIFASDLCRLI